MKKLKSQSGRSMVEMLGVLAIIGVLSVGGIAGYSLSMRKHRANQIIDTASKYALVAYGHCQQKVIDGEVPDVYECGHREDPYFPTFSDADVGALPAGVTSIKVTRVEKNSAGRGDDVYVKIDFSDTKLCQASASIIGNYSNCDKNTAYLYIAQN